MTNKVSECIHGIFPREYRDINLPVDASQGVSLSNDPPGLVLAVPVVVKRHAGEAVYRHILVADAGKLRPRDCS